MFHTKIVHVFYQEKMCQWKIKKKMKNQLFHNPYAVTSSLIWTFISMERETESIVHRTMNNRPSRLPKLPRAHF